MNEPSLLEWSYIICSWAESGYQGMWHKADHLLERSYCLNRLAAEYGQLNLPYSKLEITQFGSSGCNK